MSKELKCPLCGCKDLVKSEAGNDKYFLFILDDKWICQNCGCFFSEEENLEKPITATRISKRAFFKIIFSAMQEICSDKKLKRTEKKRVIHAYAKRTKIYYKEVAEMQANLFFESDCIQKDAWLIDKLKSMNSKLYLHE
ncbi:MAG: hypothetical protein K2N65_00385 [Anaeroplasmataceae bacterium]|nr:hypothetical protein [Anaeroplasmataceae bacterium]